MTGRRVLVFGGRRYADVAAVDGAMAAVHRDLGPIAVLIHGDAGEDGPDGGVPVRGADRLAGSWAERRGIAVARFPYPRGSGRAGGPLRNAAMLAEGRPDVAVGFPGDRGTRDMATRALAAGVPVYRVDPDARRLVRVAGWR